MEGGGLGAPPFEEMEGGGLGHPPFQKNQFLPSFYGGACIKMLYINCHKNRITNEDFQI